MRPVALDAPLAMIGSVNFWFQVRLATLGACLHGHTMRNVEVTSWLVTSMHRPNWLKLTICVVSGPAAPAPTAASGAQFWMLSYERRQLLPLPRTTRLPAVFWVCTLKQKPSSVVPFVVPSKLAESLKLHCCCGFVTAAHCWNTTMDPLACGVPASRHMPRALAAVTDAVNCSVRFML